MSLRYRTEKLRRSWEGRALHDEMHSSLKRLRQRAMLEKYAHEGGLSSLLNRHRVRRTGQPVPSLLRAPSAARCDAPYPWRMDWSRLARTAAQRRQAALLAGLGVPSPRPRTVGVGFCDSLTRLGTVDVGLFELAKKSASYGEMS